MTPEGRVKTDIKRWLALHGVFLAGAAEYYAEAPNILGWYYMPVQNGMGTTGISDFVCCIRGRFVSIEAKAPGKHASPAQQDRGNEIIAAGGRWMCIDSASLLEPLVEEFDLHG
jgi:hypothetical protein